MYTEFYGLRELPFSLTPDPRFLYFTPSHKEVLANLRYGITNGKGLIVVTGEVGTGKTTIVRWMLEHFDRTVLVAYIFNPRLTVNEFYQHMAQLLDIQNWSSKSDLMLELGRTLEARQARGLRTVLIIDEAQGLPPFVLEEIRLLMNFESNTAKHLQIILTGQPELRDVLNSQELRQLKQRIALRSEIQPLPNVTETENYILERLRVAGATEPNIFSPEAIDFIFRCSEGIPRLVNNLCDNAMLLGYGAELPIIGRKVIEEVAENFDLLPRKERSVLEAEYDHPTIFTSNAQDRMREEKMEQPKLRNGAQNGANHHRPETKNGHSRPATAPANGAARPVEMQPANGNGRPRVEQPVNGAARPLAARPANGNGHLRVDQPVNGSARPHATGIANGNGNGNGAVHPRERIIGKRY
jgi:general secretion pathway protein A